MNFLSFLLCLHYCLPIVLGVNQSSKPKGTKRKPPIVSKGNVPKLLNSNDPKLLIQQLKDNTKVTPKVVDTVVKQVSVNDCYNGVIKSLSDKGEGVTTINNSPLPIKIPDTLPGDHVYFQIASLKPTHIEGKLIELKKHSTQRIQPTCSIAQDCGGCQLQYQNYTSQLLYKYTNIKTCFDKYPSLKTINIRPVTPSLDIHGYRNRAQFSIQRTSSISSNINNKLKSLSTPDIYIGLYKKKSHDVINTLNCDIQHTAVNQILTTIHTFFKKYPQISIYNEYAHMGALRHIVIRTGFQSNEVMICFVSAEKEVKYLDLLVHELHTTNTRIKSILLHYNPHATDIVLYPQSNITSTHILHGNNYIVDTIANVKVKISLFSFTQSNPIQASILYEMVTKLANFNGNEVVYDLYCGIGMIGLRVASLVKQVIGVEDVHDAIVDANINKDLNNITNIDFICNKAEHILQTFPIVPNEVVIVNPPRKGCDSQLLYDIAKRNISKLIYVSCNPETLVRDLNTLTSLQYDIIQVQPVDMFPHTIHVETVVLLHRRV